MALSITAASCGDEADDGAAPPPIEVTLTDGGCEPAAITAVAGRLRFHLTSESSGAVTEFEILQDGHIVTEIENIAAGLDRTLTTDLEPGSYTTYCPGATREEGTLEVTEP